MPCASAMPLEDAKIAPPETLRDGSRSEAGEVLGTHQYGFVIFEKWVRARAFYGNCLQRPEHAGSMTWALQLASVSRTLASLSALQTRDTKGHGILTNPGWLRLLSGFCSFILRAVPFCACLEVYGPKRNHPSIVPILRYPCAVCRIHRTTVAGGTSITY